MSRYSSAHQNIKGPGDARPTALQIVQDENLVGKLADKVVLVTGANQGIGLETARALHATGATVYLGVRDPTRGQAAIDDIRATNNNNNNTAVGAAADRQGRLHLIQMHLDSLASVRRAAETFLSQSTQLNILVLNAGVMSRTKTKTEDGFELTFATNHLGHFLLFQLLKPLLLASSSLVDFQSRVVAVSSQLHRCSEIRFDDYNFDEAAAYAEFQAYGQSKTANIYLANEIERRYGSQGLHGLSLHPGVILTNLARRQDAKRSAEELRAAMGDGYDEMVHSMKSQPQGAATTVYAALSKEWEGKGGRYLSNCAEMGPAARGADPFSSDNGYAPWVYDEQKAERLWRESNKMVGLEEDA